jgi:cation diffusion facilitator family transporter
MTDLRRLLAAFAVCVAAAAAELVGAAFTQSVALAADGLHSLAHVGALALALMGAVLAHRRGPAARRTAALVNALLILALAAALAVESLRRLSGPQAVLYDPAIVVTAFGLLANMLTILALGGGSPEDLNHRAALLHMVGDAAVALLALAGLGAGRLFGWSWADPLAGLAGAVVLFVIAARLLKQMLGKVPAPTPLRS